MKLQKKLIRYWDKIMQKLPHLFFLLPLFFILTLVVAYPLFSTFYLSFFKKDIININPVFCFFDNYILVLQDKTFLMVLNNTLIWTVGNVILTFLIGLTLALILSDPKLKFRKFFSNILILPWAFSIPGHMSWIWLLNSDYGFFNQLLLDLGVIRERIAWLSEPSIALFSCIIPNTWHMFPYMTTMLLAGVLAIPKELYEASEIDGANKLQKFIHITIPQLKPVMLVAIILYTIWTMNSFVPYVLVPGGLGNRVVTLPIYIYKTFFIAFNFGIGAAMSVFLFLANLVLVIIYLRSVRTEW
ncbi:MAG: sugar ABC transporter permease [Candidatus Micrarchaeia archaeon]